MSSTRPTIAPAALTISVIVPVLNEARRLNAQLDRLRRLPELREVIVVDGGSADGSLHQARRHSGCVTVLESARGRARQMNAGARRASGDILVFLHADVWLPAGAPTLIRAALAHEDTVAGAFRTWTVPDGPTWLGPLLHLADLRSRLSGLPYGDQALFVRAPVFRAVGGFPELPIMEDLALSERLRRRGRIARVPANVLVSGRRFLARPVYYTLLVNVLPALWRLGVPADVLARMYGDAR